MKQILIQLLISASLVVVARGQRYVVPAAPCVVEKTFKVAHSQVGVTEKTGHNDGQNVRMYLLAVHLPEGYPYCSAFWSWCFLEVTNKPPIKITPLAYQIFADGKSRGVYDGNFPHPHDLVIWKFSGTTSGHVGGIDSVGTGGWIYTTEANTSSGSKGSQRDGGGVYQRRRNVLMPLGKMMTAGFIGFK